MLCCSSGCVTAARKVEQAMRGDREKPERRSERTAPLEAADLRFDVKPDHPRLFVTGDWPAPTDAIGTQWRDLLIHRADDTIDKPPIDYSAKKLLTRSREALKRISLLGGVYRFTGDKKYAAAGRRELLSVCSFPDWQPGDFLATAEMMNAVSIGYDWLYDTLSPADRRTVVNAIVENGLKPGLDAYASRGGWTTARHNWNLVCNGGVIVGALAVASEEPATAKRTLGYALASIREGLAAYDVNGGTAEGPMYHSYATRYATFAAAAMKTATTGTSVLSMSQKKDWPYELNWTRAADYRLAMTGPTGKSANFGDGAEILGNTAWMLWLASAQDDTNYDASRYVAFESDVDRAEPSVFDLLWYCSYVAHAPQRNPAREKAAPGSIAFGSAIVLRPSAEDPQAPFLVLRTGSTADHHSHLDLGNFVLDMLGERFATDLGADNYDLPGYLGPRRADYLRSSTPGHNTLSIGDASQPGDAESKSSLAPDGKSAQIDMTEAYPGARSVVRTVEVSAGQATITDAIRVKRDATFTWNLHTPAKVTPTRGGAVLDVNGKQISMSILEPRDAKLTIEPDETQPPELAVQGVTHVRVKVNVQDQTKIVIQFQPLAALKRERKL